MYTLVSSARAAYKMCLLQLVSSRLCFPHGAPLQACPVGPLRFQLEQKRALKVIVLAWCRESAHLLLDSNICFPPFPCNVMALEFTYEAEELVLDTHPFVREMPHFPCLACSPFKVNVVLFLWFASPSSNIVSPRVQLAFSSSKKSRLSSLHITGSTTHLPKRGENHWKKTNESNIKCYDMVVDGYCNLPPLPFISSICNILRPTLAEHSFYWQTWQNPVRHGFCVKHIIF